MGSKAKETFPVYGFLIVMLSETFFMKNFLSLELDSLSLNIETIKP